MDRVKFYINEKTHIRKRRPWIRQIRDSSNIETEECPGSAASTRSTYQIVLD